VSIVKLVYLLYFCASVYMYMFVSLFVNYIMRMYSGPEAAYY